MKINRLTASFGKLENATLSFHDGLNIIYAPNESGKSTWCAFIMAMLYGVDSAERQRSGHLPDKQKYMPWSGAQMEGTMDLTADRCDITVTRTTRQKNAPMREFSAVYKGTSIPVENMNGSNCGEQLTGITRDVFRRSAFIAQGSMEIGSSAELEKRISAIVSTGEEELSYTEADERLRVWQRKRRSNRRGWLPELEAGMDETQRRLADAQKSADRLEQLETELVTAKAECAELEKKVADYRRVQRRDSLRRLHDGREYVKECERRHDDALTALSEKKEQLRESAFCGCDEESASREAQADINTCGDIDRQLSEKISPFWPVLLFVLAVACAAVYTAVDNLILIICASLFCLLAVILMLNYVKARNSVNELKEERRRIMRRYKTSDTEGIRACLDEYLSLWEDLHSCEEQELEIRQAYGDAEEQYAELERLAIEQLDFSSGNAESTAMTHALSAARDRTLELSSEISSLKGSIAVSGDPMALESDLTAMQEKYDVISGEFEAIELAVNTLREADVAIQSRFSPELGKIAAEYMSVVTDGRYEDIFINRDFSARTRTKDDPIAREAEYLSKGTLDLMYIAVRLAVCEFTMANRETCPLIIDDAFVNLDETRFSQAMRLLREISRDRQVIMFTCRKS